MMTGLKRVIKGGFLNFKRGGVVSWAAVLVVTITLSVITFIILLQAVLHFSLNQIKDKVDVTIYFTTGAPEDQILALKSSLEQLPEVASVSYTSADDALAQFRDRHESDYPTIQALDELGTNPLGAYLNIKAKDVSQYGDIATFLQSDNAISLAVEKARNSLFLKAEDSKALLGNLYSDLTGRCRSANQRHLDLLLINDITTYLQGE